MRKLDPRRAILPPAAQNASPHKVLDQQVCRRVIGTSGSNPRFELRRFEDKPLSVFGDQRGENSFGGQQVVRVEAA